MVIMFMHFIKLAKKSDLYFLYLLFRPENLDLNLSISSILRRKFLTDCSIFFLWTEMRKGLAKLFLMDKVVQLQLKGLWTHVSFLPPLCLFLSLFVCVPKLLLFLFVSFLCLYVSLSIYFFSLSLWCVCVCMLIRHWFPESAFLCLSLSGVCVCVCVCWLDTDSPNLHFFASLYLSLCLCVSLSVCLLSTLFSYICISFSFCLVLCLFFCLSVCLFLCLFSYLSVCVPICHFDSLFLVWFLSLTLHNCHCVSLTLSFSSSLTQNLTLNPLSPTHRQSHTILTDTGALSPKSNSIHFSFSLVLEIFIPLRKLSFEPFSIFESFENSLKLLVEVFLRHRRFRHARQVSILQNLFSVQNKLECFVSGKYFDANTTYVCKHTQVHLPIYG